jgi:hypothetical protein
MHTSARKTETIMDTARFGRRIGVPLALLLVGVLAQPTLANEQSDYKEKFKAGCAAAKQKWQENSDGSYQCTTSTGEVNICYKTTPPTPCVHKKF